MSLSSSTLVFAHIGDLHITGAREQNYVDLLRIVAEIANEYRGALDFVVLPGDNADNGRPEQYALIETALRMLEIPVYLIGGDHDMEQGGLDNMYALTNARRLPFSVVVKGCRCLFLDVNGPGKGGPDFRLGNKQLEWLAEELALGAGREEPCLLFMHTYPDDLRDMDEKRILLELLHGHDVVLVDMGHTHYNEIANDGRTIFTATRSTGQIEEGGVGYSVVSVQRGVVSWRFKMLAEPFPFVLITSPPDVRLRRLGQRAVDGEVTALVFGQQKVTGVTFSIGDGQVVDMNPVSRGYSGRAAVPVTGVSALTVRATDARGRIGMHTVEVTGDPLPVPAGFGDGSDRASIGAWPQNGIYGTQLGPNRNAKPLPKK